MTLTEARHILDDARAGYEISPDRIHLALIICGDTDGSPEDFPKVEHKQAGAWQVTGFDSLPEASWLDPIARPA
jgi:hypothetical protein